MEQIPLDVIKEKLRDRYETSGFSEALFRNDFNLLLRMGVHPQVATLDDLQRIVMTAKAPSTRANYASRLRSMYKAMNKMKLVDNRVIEDLPTPRKGRGLPHPLTPNQAKMLMAEARQPMRDWYVIGCGRPLPLRGVGRSSMALLSVRPILFIALYIERSREA